MSKDAVWVMNGLRVPWSIISTELDGLYGSNLLHEFNEIISYYKVYEHGADFTPENSKGDFTGSDLKFRGSRNLINKEARFLFSKHPDIFVNVPYDKDTDDETTKKQAQESTTILQSYIDKIFEKTGFFSKLVKAAKDCFIGKRVAYFVNFDEINKRIMVDFIPSLEFVFDTDQSDLNKITKIVAFYTVSDSQNRTEQRIYKKKYWLADDAEETCWINEAIYDGTGTLIEEITPDRATLFKGVIPAGVIINDGLTGDLEGISEIEELEDSESWYSRIANGDIDSERCGMNPIRWARDMNPSTTKNLSIAPGAFWDLASDPNAPDGVTGELGMMETALNYSSALNSTLSRIRSSMYESLDMPDVSPDALKGVVSSGKTLQAIYWSLIVRCDEKMLAWRPALTNIARLLIEGGKLYPNSASSYTEQPIPDTEYDIEVDNQYPIPDDEESEKSIDLAEVNAQTMSKMAYMKKWRNLTDAEAMQELRQIALEREMLENSYGNMEMQGDMTEQQQIEDDDLDDDTIDDESVEGDQTYDQIISELEAALNE